MGKDRGPTQQSDRSDGLEVGPPGDTGTWSED